MEGYSDSDFSFKRLFIPLTTKKAIFWLVVIGFMVYFNSLLNGFSGDDNGQILNNPLVHSLINLPSFFRGSTLFIKETNLGAGLYYRPIVTTVFSVIYSIFGSKPFFFHLFQLSLHVIISSLIFLIFKKHLHKNISFVLAILFLLHPINNETVVYISNLQEELFSLFGLLALNLIYTKKFFKLVPVVLLFSVLSKESGIMFIPAVIIYYFSFAEKTKQNTKYLLISSIVTILFYVFLRVLIGNTGLQTSLLYMSENTSLLDRLVTIPSILFYYLKMLFFPTSIAFGWFWVIKNPNFVNFGLPLIGVMVFFTLLILPLKLLSINGKLKKLYIFFLIFFILNISLILQIFPLDFTVADRWFYMPLFCLLGMLGVVSESITLKNRHQKTVLIGIVSLIIVFFSVQDFQRNFNWFDNLTICQHDAQINTNSYVLEFCIANELYNKKDYNLAKIHALKATELYPRYFFSWYTLGKIYYAVGENDAAMLAFEKTLALNDFALGSGELSLLLVYEKKPVEAKNVTQKYLKKLPNSTELWYATALAEYLLGNKSEATAAAQKAYSLEPSAITEKVYFRLSNNLPISF